MQMYPRRVIPKIYNQTILDPFAKVLISDKMKHTMMNLFQSPKIPNTYSLFTHINSRNSYISYGYPFYVDLHVNDSPLRPLEFRIVKNYVYHNVIDSDGYEYNDSHVMSYHIPDRITKIITKPYTSFFRQAYITTKPVPFHWMIKTSWGRWY